jgi:hypothetical protein
MCISSVLVAVWGGLVWGRGGLSCPSGLGGGVPVGYMDVTPTHHVCHVFVVSLYLYVSKVMMGIEGMGVQLHLAHLFHCQVVIK